MSIGPLTFELCDLDQGVLATLGDRFPDAKVDIPRHAARTAQVTLALEDEAAPWVSVGDTVLRCKVVGWTDPLFVGRVTLAETTFTGDTETLTVSAADPWAHLQKKIVLITGLGFTPTASAYKEFSATQQAQIMWDLINLHSDHGIAQGTLVTSVTRTATFPAGSGVADGVNAMAALFNGAEWELSPVEETDGTLVEFNTFHPRQGSDLSGSVILTIGIDEDDNADSLSIAPGIDGMVNKYTVIGDVSGTATKGGLDYPLHPAYTAEHAGSVSTYGTWEGSDSVVGLTDAGLLEAIAKARVAANAFPIERFSVGIDPDTGPDFGPDGDFWVGDTIALQAGLPNETLNIEGRVGAASFAEGSEGEVDVTLTCDPDTASSVTGAALSVVMDSSEGTVPPPPPEEVPIDTAPEPKKKKKKKKKKKRK